MATDGEPRSVRIWDVATGKLVRTLKGLDEFARPVGFSPDGRRILVASGDTPGTRLLDVESGKRVGAGVYPETGPYTFSPNGQRLLALSHEDIQLIVTENGQPIVTLAGQIPVPDSRRVPAGRPELYRRQLRHHAYAARRRHRRHHQHLFADIPAR